MLGRPWGRSRLDGSFVAVRFVVVMSYVTFSLNARARAQTHATPDELRGGLGEVRLLACAFEYKKVRGGFWG